jgi:RNA polymerase sigma-70 factor (ECF subfamily)
LPFPDSLLRCDRENVVPDGGRERIGLMEASGVLVNGETQSERLAQSDVRRLVDEAQGGDRAALEELYLLHFDRIYSYLQLSVGNRHDAEDLTNQTFIKMLESIDRFVWRQAPFSAWLFRIAHNLAMDHFRAGRRWQTEGEVPEDSYLREPSAEDTAIHDLGHERMLGMLDGLSDEQRQVMTLKFGFDLSNGEVATVLGKTEGAVKALQNRAFGTLQRRYASAKTA